MNQCKHDKCDRRIQTWRTKSLWCWVHRPCDVCGGEGAKAKSQDDRWPGHWCDKCYQRYIRQGNPTEAHPYGPGTLEERFNLYLPDGLDGNGCLIWQGMCVGRMGYGFIGNDGRMEAAHRVSWRLKNGPIPNGALVLHHCDVPPCVREEHLYLGTHADNMRDCIGRRRKQLAFTDEETREVRRIYETGVSMTRIAKDRDVSRATVAKCIHRRGTYGLID